MSGFLLPFPYCAQLAAKPLTILCSCCLACQQEPLLRQADGAHPAALPFNDYAHLLLSWQTEALSSGRQVCELNGQRPGLEHLGHIIRPKVKEAS